MAFTFADLQSEIKRRATRDQSGTQFDTAVKNVINTSLFRIAREAKWRALRRTGTFETVTQYTTGSGGGTFTNGSKSVTMTGATLLTDNVQPGRRVTLQGSNRKFTIETITSETAFTIDRNYDGTTISGTGTYTILAQEKYLLPVQASSQMFLWHEEYGFPFQLTYLPEQDFISISDNTRQSRVTHYHMWGEDMVREQLKEASVVSISSSDSSDTNIPVTVFGIVSGYPDFETITTNSSNGTTAAAGSKSFSSVERVVKASSTTGRLTLTGNSANTTVAVIPAGDISAGILYRKVRLWPLPNTVFPMNVYYYKEPYRLVNDGDVHELGQEFDEAIVLLGTSKLKDEQNQDEGSVYRARYREEIKNLKRTNVDKMDWLPKLRRGLGRGFPRVHRNLLFQQIGAEFGPSQRLS